MRAVFHPFVCGLLALGFVLQSCDTQCVNGIGNFSVLQRAGTLLYGQRTRYSQQSLMPSLLFTCNGTLTALAFAVAAQGGFGTLLPELQIWRPAVTNGSSYYVKVFSTNQLQPRRTAMYSSVYVYRAVNLTQQFRAGDVIGTYQPSREDSSYVLLYQDSRAGPAIRWQSETSSSNVSLLQPGVLTNQSAYPLIAVETSDLKCVTKLMNADALVSALNATSTSWIVLHSSELRVFTTLNFTCRGFVSRWLFVADERGGNEPIEMQIWRRNDTARKLVKVGSHFASAAATVQLSGNGNSNIYQAIPSARIYVEVGDILGVYQPDLRNSSFVLAYITTMGAPSYSFGGQSLSVNTINLSGGVPIQSDFPLIFVEISSDCGPVRAPPNGRVNVQQSPQADGTLSIAAIYWCSEGYVLRGTARSTCSNGVWTADPPSCNNATCSNLDAPLNGAVSIVSRGDVQVAMYGCNTGYQMFGNLTRVCYAERGTWSDSQPYCQASPLSCGNPPSIDKSNAWVTTDSSGTPVVVYSCPNVYSGSARLSCQNGSWYGQPPACNLDQSDGPNQGCDLPTQVLFGGHVTIENTTNGTVKVTYSCEQGFQMIGNNTRICQLDGTWSGNTPLCLHNPASTASTPPSTAVTTSLPSLTPDGRDLSKDGSLNIKILTTATIVSLLSVILIALATTVLLYLRHLSHKWQVMTSRTKRNQHSSSVINNPIYEAQSPSHQRYVSRHLSTRECLICNQPNMAQAVGLPSDQNLDYEMQSMGYTGDSISGHNNTLYVEAASVEMPLGYAMPQSTTNTGTGTLYGALVWSIYVPTQEQRQQLASAALSASYEFDAEEPHRDFFEEVETYWKPASDTISLYGQLAIRKYREILRHQIQIKTQLGAGQFGMVHKGLWQASKDVQLEVAVKMLRPGASEGDVVKFLQEAAVNGQFHHPNVVRLLGVVTVGNPVMIVLELLVNGDLKSYLNKRSSDKHAEWPLLLLRFCADVAHGMEYLSKKAFVHRDLAARNILVSKDFICKISDFGMSRDLVDDIYYISHGGKVPVKWTAPEALHYKKYSTASDVWSFGCVLFEIWSLGRRPFEMLTNQETVACIDKGARLSPPPGCPRAVFEVMMSCWHPCSTCRPSFSELVYQFSRPSSQLLHWTEEDALVHPLCTKVGATLEAGDQLYPELQCMYFMTELSLPA